MELILGVLLIVILLILAGVSIREGRGRLRQAEADESVKKAVLSDAPRLRESFGSAGSKPHLRHVPRPGTAVMEVLDASNNVLASDTFDVAACAPHGSAEGFTSVLAPVGAEVVAYKFWEAPISDASAPLPIPAHLASKPNAFQIRLWWSCDHV